MSGDQKAIPGMHLFISAVLATILVGVYDAAVISRAQRQLAAIDFPVTTGVITHSDIEVDERRDREDGRNRTRRYYRPRISFEYSVDGTSYEASGHRFGVSSTTRRGHAAAVTQRYRVGDDVTVYYNPARPRDAVLEVGTSTADAWLVSAVAPLTVGVLGLWGHAIRTRWRHTRLAATGGVPVRRRGEHLHVLLPRFLPAAMGWGCAMWTSIAGVLIVGFDVGGTPLSRLRWVLLAAAAVGVVAFITQSLLIVRAGRELIIDSGLSVVRLPRTFGRTHSQTVRTDAIDHIKVVQRASPGTETTIYAPTIVHRDDTGESYRETLAEWTQPHRAESLVGWLNQQIRAS